MKNQRLTNQRLTNERPVLPADVDHPGPGVEEGEEELAGPLVGPVVGGQGHPGLTSQIGDH